MLTNILIAFGIIFVITTVLSIIYGDIKNSKIKNIIYIIISVLIGIIVSPSLLLVGYMFNSYISG